MSNSQMLDHLRYAADNFVFHQDEVQANLRDFAASLIGAGISPPAQKTASVPGGSGAGLAGNPSLFDFADSLPVTMSGDAWEAAALYVLSLRTARPMGFGHD